LKRTNDGIDSASLEAEERRGSAKRRLLDLVGSGGLGDAEAMGIAEEAVRRARSEASERERESPAPLEEEVRKVLGSHGPGGTGLV